MILYYTATGTELGALEEAVRDLRRGGLTVPLRALFRETLPSEGELASLARRARALVLVPHGGEESLPGLSTILAAFSGEIVHVQPVSGSPADLSLAERYARPRGKLLKRRQEYLSRGGVENLKGFLLALLAELGEAVPSPPPPKEIPSEGIWHPEGGFFPDPEAYLSWLRKRPSGPSPLVGIWFYQGYFVNGDLAPVKALVEELESRGLWALPVFHRRFVAEGEGLPPNRVAEGFFRKGGRTVVSVLVNLQPFSHRLLWPETGDLYPSLGVPVVHGVISFSDPDHWRRSPAGLSPLEVSVSVAQPEFDGVIVSRVVAGRRLSEPSEVLGVPVPRLVPVEEGIRAVVEEAAAWVRLAETPPGSRRIAIVLHHYPPREDRMGCAFGLDSFASVVRLLEILARKGYRVERSYSSGEELAQAFRRLQIYDARYLSPGEMWQRALVRWPVEAFRPYFRRFPRQLRRRLEEAWGPFPGTFLVQQGAFLFSGLRNGNILLTLQPPRGKIERLSAGAVHDPALPPPYHYLAFYTWLREEFRAHAVIHVGKHGTLEWLPGKAVGLSEECFPAAALGPLPNLYPYIVNNPGEGTQAKRRSHAVIVSHLPPARQKAGLHGPLERLSELLAEYRESAAENPALADSILKKILELSRKEDLFSEVGLSPEEVSRDAGGFLRRLHEYLEEVAETYVNRGLHVLGVPPEGEALSETVSAIRRHTDLSESRLKELLSRATEEVEALLSGLSGGFVPPGASGAITRGAVEALPTGRNFHSVDPHRIPTRTAFERGVRQAEALMERHRRDHGRPLRTLAMVLWGSPTMRTRGEDFACALWLLGVRPGWREDGRVKGLEVVPLSELGRPRVDVTLTVSGFFRDAFRNLMELFDRAVAEVAALPEPPEMNPLAENFRRDLERLLTEGLPRDEARLKARFRVFSEAPGTYGNGVETLLDAGAWQSRGDLGRMYLSSMAYAYGEGAYGEKAVESLRAVLSRTEATYKNEDTREVDILSCDCFNAYHGGLNAAVEAVRGTAPVSYSASGEDPEKPRVRTTAEEMRFLFRIKVLNPRWIEALKTHGFKGAGDLSRTVDLVFHWDATSGVVSDRMWRDLAETYAFDASMQEFFRRHNPAALLNIAERLLEAIRRGLWENPDPEIRSKLEDLYLSLEAEVE
ncbi:cobaltochelatase subunit CobN [Thermosulfurimonas sp. F29]|uniref:cobaltochelatase subunit CobN n=1 Tax=Thermosulfurimonas sp. F29 TaxID=2867247 RepID=UPI001C83ECE4|nr:cobaltochelatase subunit CobN [Thermosulfurimonas sp. F29]MBX6422951.1 cobaltochelatase subunit CobN [Thermosulfurimonas sp. F29]